MKPLGAYTAVIGEGAALYADALAALCAGVILLPPCASLDPRVASHPDMLLALPGERCIVPAQYAAQPCASRALAALEHAAGARIESSPYPIGGSYPADIGYNVLLCGDILCGLLPHVSPDVLRAARETGLRTVSVKQGYAGCSTLVCGELAVTADPSVRAALAQEGVPVFSLPPGGVSLAGYSCGFIGGASGYAADTAVFFGDPALHPRGAALCAELERRNIAVYALSGAPLCDFGGIRFIKNRADGCRKRLCVI